MPGALDEARRNGRGDEQHGHEQQPAPQEDGCEEPVLGVADAIAEHRDEPQKGDPRERHKTEREQDGVAA